MLIPRFASSQDGDNDFVTFLGSEYAKINRHLYAGLYEVSNYDYKKFLESIKRDSSEKSYNECLIDTIKWETTPGLPITKNEHNITVNYHRHTKFLNYPVVNVSWQSANRYCEWLTKRYEMVNRKKHRHYVFSLPTSYEWELLADPDQDNYPKGFSPLIDPESDCYKANIRTIKNIDDRTDFDGGFYMVLVDAYPPNRYNLFTVIGNVSEMTSTKDLEKGGSWWTKFEDCAINKTEAIPAPDPRVGFRVIVRVEKK